MHPVPCPLPTENSDFDPQGPGQTWLSLKGLGFRVTGSESGAERLVRTLNEFCFCPNLGLRGKTLKAPKPSTPTNETFHVDIRGYGKFATFRELLQK